MFNAGNARSYISEQRFPNHILSGKFDGRSTVSNLAKDLAMADAFANEVGEANAYTALTAEILAKAMEKADGPKLRAATKATPWGANSSANCTSRGAYRVANGQSTPMNAMTRTFFAAKSARV